MVTTLSDVKIRNFSTDDIPMVLDYWYRSPAGFLESLGVDLKKMPSEEEMKKNIETPETSLRVQTILFRGEAIGIHTLAPVFPGDYAIFHAHIINPLFRRKGIALFSYPQACENFFKHFSLKKILFKTPLQNKGALKVKEKLEIRIIGEEIINFSFIREGTKALVFELLPEELPSIFQKLEAKKI